MGKKRVVTGGFALCKSRLTCKVQLTIFTDNELRRPNLTTRVSDEPLSLKVQVQS